MSASGAKHGQGNRRDQGHRSKTGAPALQHGPIPTVSWPAILDRCRIWRHGYDLSKETGLRSGTLYPLLMRLSEQGLLESRWQDAERPGLPPRHVYRLTARGLALAHEQETEVTLSDRAGATA
jgi:PadR family transcriptional regulator PadR